MENLQAKAFYQACRGKLLVFGFGSSAVPKQVIYLHNGMNQKAPHLQNSTISAKQNFSFRPRAAFSPPASPLENRFP